MEIMGIMGLYLWNAELSYFYGAAVARSVPGWEHHFVPVQNKFIWLNFGTLVVIVHVFYTTFWSVVLGSGW